MLLLPTGDDFLLETGARGFCCEMGPLLPVVVLNDGVLADFETGGCGDNGSTVTEFAEDNLEAMIEPELFC